MSISIVSNRWLNRVYKSIALLLVLFAVLISALRLMLPYAENYRQDVENFVNDRYKSNVVIGQLSMGWYETGPTLIANNVQLINNDFAELSVASIDIRLNFWQSVFLQQIITDDFILSGARLTLDRQALLETSSTTPGTNQDKVPILEGLADLFYQQIDQFSIRDSQVIVNNGQRKRTFLISALDWLNLDDRHLAKADVIVDGLTSNNIKLSLDVAGNKSKEINGAVHIEGNNLNITPWLDQVLAIDNENTQSSINFSAWLTVNNGLAQELQLAFTDSEISWQHKKKSQRFTLDSGQLLLSNLDDFSQLNLESTPLQFSANNQNLPPLTVEFRRDQDDLFTYFSYLDLGSLTTLFPLFSADEKMRATVESLAMQGSVGEFYLQSQAGDYQLSAEFDQVSTAFSQGMPGIKNSQGSVLFADNKLLVNLTASQGALDFDRHFILPIPYDDLSVDFTVAFDDKGWRMTTQSLSLNSEELKLSAEIGVDVPKEGLAEMSLLASVTDGHAELAHHYFPLTLMSENLIAYLKTGLVSGDIDQALVIYRGAFADFPFDNRQGVFTVDAELSNSQFNFDDNWADITDFAANLNFTNNSMMITGRAGSLSGLDVSGVEVGIAELAGDSILTVDIDLKNVDPSNVTQLMLNSSLKDSVGETLAHLNLSKEISGEFSLLLPLDRPEEVVAKGLINFNDNLLDLQSPQMAFSQLEGQLVFNNTVINTRDLTLTWQGMPVKLNIEGRDKGNYFSTNIHLKANWQQESWQVHVPKLLKKYAEGQLQWQGDLSLNAHRDGGFSYDFAGSSLLRGIALTIPAPYNKGVDDESAFSVNISGGYDASTLDINLGEHLSFYGLLNHSAEGVAQLSDLEKASDQDRQAGVYFPTAHLILGNEKMLLPMNGFHITSALAEVDFTSWQPFISDILDSFSAEKSASSLLAVQGRSNIKHSQSRPLLAAPDRIRGSIGQLNVLGQSLTDVSFNVLDQKDWWLLQLNAKEARTEIKFYPSWLEQGIEVKADFLHLSSEYTLDDQPEILVSKLGQVNSDNLLFSRIPPMRLSCDSCRVGKIDFGQLTFELQRNQVDKIDLTQFIANRKKNKLTLTGFWQFDEALSDTSRSQTVLAGNLSVNDIEFEMDNLGFASSITESGAKLDFSFDWQGGPQDFLVNKLNGSINAKVDDGLLSDVDDKGLRVASILSLGSLARKLKLDFRDIFSEGMFYSNITGDFDIKKGVFYTENTKMNGAAGDLVVKGNTDLTSGLLDYRMNYKPNLTSSLPTIAWIATLNPVAFLTGLAINEIITASVINEVVFEVTGDLNEPIVREVNRKSKDVSVGRSTPPKVIEKPTEPQSKMSSGAVNQYQEVRPSDHPNVFPLVKGTADG